MDWIGITCWVVLGASGLVTLWALFWDRPRGRIRCRKCAYDMSGGGLTCPECGREHKAERSLRKARRNWSIVIAGSVAICCALLVKMQRYSIYHEGLSGLIPTYVLARFADVQRIEIGMTSTQTWADTKLRKRLTEFNAGEASYRLWAKKLQEYMLKVETGEIEVETYDVTHITLANLNKAPYCRAYYNLSQSNFDRNQVRGLLAESITKIILQQIWSQDQSPTRKSGYAYKVVGYQLVLSATREEHQMFRHMLSQIESRRWSAGDGLSFSVGSHRSFIRYDVSSLFVAEELFSPELFYETLGYIEMRILPIPLEAGYGDAASVTPLVGELVVWADPEYHKRMMEYLRTVEVERSASE